MAPPVRSLYFDSFVHPYRNYIQNHFSVMYWSLLWNLFGRNSMSLEHLRKLTSARGEEETQQIVYSKCGLDLGTVSICAVEHVSKRSYCYANYRRAHTYIICMRTMIPNTLHLGWGFPWSKTSSKTKIRMDVGSLEMNKKEKESRSPCWPRISLSDRRANHSQGEYKRVLRRESNKPPTATAVVRLMLHESGTNVTP